MSSQKPDEISLDGDTTVPLARLLGRLSTSQRPLPSAACAQLGLPEATRLGDAAVALLLAVRDPSGPRCRSYRSAAFYLRGLHHLSYNVDDLDLSASG